MNAKTAKKLRAQARKKAAALGAPTYDVHGVPSSVVIRKHQIPAKIMGPDGKPTDGVVLKTSLEWSRDKSPRGIYKDLKASHEQDHRA